MIYKGYYSLYKQILLYFSDEAVRNVGIETLTAELNPDSALGRRIELNAPRLFPIAIYDLRMRIGRPDDTDLSISLTERTS